MKIITVLFLSVLFGLNIFSQDYKVTIKEITDNSKKPKYEFTFDYPLIKDFNSNVTGMNMFNKYSENLANSTLDSFKVWMRDWETVPGLETGSYYEVFDSVYFTSNRLISVQFFENNYFSGAAHPNNSSFSLNYELEQYKELTLNDLLVAGWVNKISELCIADLKEQKSVPSGQENESIEIGAGPDENNFKVFNVSKTGLVITFITYQVGPYVEGPSEVFIPYSAINSYLKAGGVLSEIAK